MKTIENALRCMNFKDLETALKSGEIPTEAHIVLAAGIPSAKFLKELVTYGGEASISSIKHALDAKQWDATALLVNMTNKLSFPVAEKISETTKNWEKHIPPKQKELREACRRGDITGIENALQASELNRPEREKGQPKPSTPLGICIKQKEYEAARYLLISGANPNTPSEGESPLTLARRAPELISALLHRGANPNPKIGCPNGNTPLHYAVMDGEETTCALLIDAGADTKRRNSKGELPKELNPKMAIAIEVGLEKRKNRKAKKTFQDQNSPEI